MGIEEIEALYRNRQSCRAFNGAPVDGELLKKVCSLALLAPSACNAQPWRLFVLTGEKQKEATAALQRLGMNKFASKAGALVVVAEGKSNLTARLGGKLKDSDFTANDLGIITAHLVLAAEAAGLASCILGWRDEKKLCTLLGLPEKTRIPAVVALGYAEAGYPVRPKQRKEERETLTFLS